MASHGVSTDTVQKGRFLMNQHATANNEIGDEFRIGEDETGGGIQQAGFTMPKLTTLFSFLDHAERRGNLLGVWRKYFDPDGYGKVNFVQFSQAAKMLGFLGKPEAVWKELFGRLDFFGFVSNQLERKAFHDPRFLTFEKLDPFHFQMLEAFRKGLTMQFKKVKEAFGETRYCLLPQLIRSWENVLHLPLSVILADYIVRRIFSSLSKKKSALWTIVKP